MNPPPHDESSQDEDNESSQYEDLCDKCKQEECPRCIEKAEERREFWKKLLGITHFAVGIWLGFNLTRR